MISRRFSAFLPLLALGACMTPTAPTEVTRFHLGQVNERGTVAVEPALNAPGGMEFGIYARAIEQELNRIGYAPVDGVGQSLYVAVVDVRSGARERQRGSPVSIGIGGGSGVVVGTQVSVQLKRRSDQTIVWEGRARGEASERDSAGLAQRLAAALFRDFPGESGRTISVR